MTWRKYYFSYSWASSKDLFDSNDVSVAYKNLRYAYWHILEEHEKIPLIYGYDTFFYVMASWDADYKMQSFSLGIQACHFRPRS